MCKQFNTMKIVKLIFTDIVLILEVSLSYVITYLIFELPCLLLWLPYSFVSNATSGIFFILLFDETFRSLLLLFNEPGVVPDDGSGCCEVVADKLCFTLIVAVFSTIPLSSLQSMPDICWYVADQKYYNTIHNCMLMQCFYPKSAFSQQIVSIYLKNFLFWLTHKIYNSWYAKCNCNLHLFFLWSGNNWCTTDH